MSLGRDFRRLWVAFTVSAVGSAVGLGALPLIAVLVLDVSTFQVSMLAALSALAGAFLTGVEVRRYRLRQARGETVRAASARCLPKSVLILEREDSIQPSTRV